MSHDQKPSRIKLVGSAGAAGAPRDAAAIEPASEGAITDAQTAADGKRRAPVVPAILFLAGCAIGGAGLAAWPHLAG